MSKQLIAAFWEAMGSNDFTFASTWLHPDFEYYMPQSREYLEGREDFAALNANYPTDGTWTFTVREIMCDGDKAVSVVDVTDGKMKATAITFHTLKDGLILRQKEFWPDDYPAPAWRKDWARPVDAEPF